MTNPDDQVISDQEYNDFVSSLRVRRRIQSFTIEIEYTDRNPEQAAKITNAIMNAYIAEQRRVKVELVRSANEWLTRRVEELKAELVESERRVNEFRSEKAAIDARVTGALYSTFLNRVKETQSQEALQAPDARIISEAVPPTEKSWPKRSIILGLSLVIGGMAGVVIELYRSATDPVFHSIEDVASSVEGAALVEVPSIPLADRENIDIKILKSPDSKYADAIFALWQLIQSRAMTQNQTKGRLIAVVSSAEGDGKSTIALNVARCAATSGKRTLLVHANLRYAETDNVLSRPGPSLLDVIRGQAELASATYQDVKSPLDICPAPVEPVRDAALLFNSDSFHNAIAEMQKSYDIIIFDTPSLLKFNDGQAIATVTKQCLLVLRLGCSTLPDTAAILEKAAANQIAVVAVAVNPALTLDHEGFV